MAVGEAGLLLPPTGGTTSAAGTEATSAGAEEHRRMHFPDGLGPAPAGDTGGVATKLLGKPGKVVGSETLSSGVAASGANATGTGGEAKACARSNRGDDPIAVKEPPATTVKEPPETAKEPPRGDVRGGAWATGSAAMGSMRAGAAVTAADPPALAGRAACCMARGCGDPLVARDANRWGAGETATGSVRGLAAAAMKEVVVLLDRREATFREPALLLVASNRLALGGAVGDLPAVVAFREPPLTIAFATGAALVSAFDWQWCTTEPCSIEVRCSTSALDVWNAAWLPAAHVAGAAIVTHVEAVKLVKVV